MTFDERRRAAAPALTPSMMRLAARLLDLAAEEFSRHVCNDFDLSNVPGFEAHTDRVWLDRVRHEMNGDPQEHDPSTVGAITEDWTLMLLCAESLRKAAGGA